MLRWFEAAVVGCGLANVIVRYFGLTAAGPRRLEYILFSPFLLGCFALFFVLLFADSLSNRKRRFSGWLIIAGVALVCAGYWVSFGSRFSAEAVITEGQAISVSEMSVPGNKGYAGKFARVPAMTIVLDALTPDFGQDGERIQGLSGRFRALGGEGIEESFQMGLESGATVDGMQITIDDFGFSLRYELKSSEGTLLDSSFVFLDVFPPGREDYFRLLSPLTYYVRYYPFGGVEKGDPFLRIRIARNKDIVFDGKVGIGEEFAYENGRMSFPEIRSWTKVTITRDPGRPVVVGGGFLALMGVLVVVIQGKNRESQSSRSAKCAGNNDV